ncbi:hypothetical protein LCGC14_1068730 [marine sediment metagenome]|uniref:Uncharacterized protein n=1 Tax=marine sediment metagenome TaxID=412755 RepID=A0A0F9QPU0_9ZZZZ
MRVAIASHFGGFQSSYALHVGWHERARMLERFGVDFDFLVNKKCRENLYPHQVNILPNRPSSEPLSERAEFFANVYKDVLKDYDVIFTADMMYQRKGNFLACNAAQRSVAKDLKAWWCHWIHSGWTTRPEKYPWPESLRYTMPPRSFLVYLNSFELPQLAAMYGALPHQVHAVYNPKDIRSFYEMDPLAWRIIDELNIPQKRAVQIFPFCSTRMDAKGIDGVVRMMAAVKRAGLPVALVLANANSKKRIVEIEEKTKWIEAQGLTHGKDFLWTCFLNDHRPLPRKTIADLFKLSNLFTFTSYRETVGNVFQEAKISGCQLVLSSALPCLQEMGGPEAIYIETDHKTPGIRDNEPGDMQTVGYSPDADTYFDEIAEVLIPRLPDRSHQWYFSLDRIWHEQLHLLLERAYAASKGEDYMLVGNDTIKPSEVVTVLEPMEAYGMNRQWGTDHPKTDLPHDPESKDESP